MKFDEVYVPVFEASKPKIRQLRADFGSRKVGLMCSQCKHEFAKRIGPNTAGVTCPECGANRVQHALSEEAKKKLLKAKGYADNSDFKSAIRESLEVIGLLHGRTDTTSQKIMCSALDELISIEQGLIPQKKALRVHLREGTGSDELSAIASALGHNILKEEHNV